MANHMIYTLRIPLDPCNATCNEFFFHGSLEIDGAQRVALKNYPNDDENYHKANSEIMGRIPLRFRKTFIHVYIYIY